MRQMICPLGGRLKCVRLSSTCYYTVNTAISTKSRACRYGTQEVSQEHQLSLQAGRSQAEIMGKSQ